jgi:hypothetical protein
LGDDEDSDDDVAKGGEYCSLLQRAVLWPTVLTQWLRWLTFRSRPLFSAALPDAGRTTRAASRRRAAVASTAAAKPEEHGAAGWVVGCRPSVWVSPHTAQAVPSPASKQRGCDCSGRPERGQERRQAQGKGHAQEGQPSGG